VARCERKKFKFIGCEIIYREACFLAAKGPHQVDVEFLLKGLHDLETPDMLARVQAAIDAVDSAAGYEAILLGYGRCNNGVVGLVARQIPLVIPRAHDCITFFFGSRQAYQEYFDRHPGTYYMTTGWAERSGAGRQDDAQPAYGKQGVMAKLGLHESYESLVAKYGKDNADFIVQTLGDWTKNYSKLLYIEMGLCNEEPFINEARQKARDRDWQFERRRGDWTLLEKLFFGMWDEDFVVVPPGAKIVERNDEWVLDVQPGNDREQAG